MWLQAMSVAVAIPLVLLLQAACAELAESNRSSNHSPSADRVPADVAWKWFDALYDAVKLEGITPPAAARIYGIVAVALYEAVAPGSRDLRSLVGQLNDL